MTASPFSLLERVELAAREQRLAAAAQAESIVAEAWTRAGEIDARLPARAAETVRSVREAHARQASHEIAAIEAELQAFEQPSAGDIERAIARAADLIVRSVLGEEGTSPC